MASKDEKSRQFDFRVRFVMPARLFAESPAPSVSDRTMWGTASVLDSDEVEAMKQAENGYRNLGMKVLAVEPA